MGGAGGRRTDSTARHRRWGWRSAASRYGRGRGRLWCRGWRVRRLGRSATHARSGASEHGGAAADGLPPAVRVAAVPWRRGWRWRWRLGRRRAGAALWVQAEGWDGRGGDGCGSEGGSGGGGGRGRRCWWRVTDEGRGKETDRLYRSPPAIGVELCGEPIQSWTRAALASRVAGAAARAVDDATRSGASAHGGAAADGLPPAVRVAAVPWRRGWRSRGGGKAGAATAGAGRVLPAGGGGRVLGVNGRGRRKGSLPAAAEICWTS